MVPSRLNLASHEINYSIITEIIIIQLELWLTNTEKPFRWVKSPNYVVTI